MESWHIEDSINAGLVRSIPAHGVVELFTKRRQPYEPKGTPLALRNRLRLEFTKLVPTSEMMLEALYVSNDTGYVDTENVLLYNIGGAALSSACRFGVRFIREFGEPSATPENPTVWRHYHKYSLVPRGTSVHLLRAFRNGGAVSVGA